MGAVRILLILAVVLAALFAGGEHERALGPRDPIAADGSLTAGRALTIDQIEPPKPAPPGLDDPRQFEERFANSRVERYRDATLEFVKLPNSALCEPGYRKQIVEAIQNYSGVKRYMSNEYHFRSPRAGKFIDDAWTSAKDRQIEAFVTRLLEQGYFRADEIAPRQRSLFGVLADYFGTKACFRS
jgi:hypothetical protein